MAPAKTAGKTGAAQIRVADQNPLEFTGGGLPTDFDGVIKEARAVLWNYDNGNGPMVDQKGEVVIVPALRLVIGRDGEEDVTSYYSAGDRNNFWPLTEDGELVTQDESGCNLTDGVMFGLVGTRDKMGKTTNHGQFMTGLIDAKFPGEKVKSDVRFLEGAFGHWDRVAQIKRGGVVQVREGENENKNPKEILAMTAFKGFQAVAGTATSTKTAPKAAVAAKPTTSLATQSAPATNGSGAVSQKLRELIAANLPNEGGMKQGSFAQLVMKSANFTLAERSTAVKTISSEWLEAWANEEGAPIIYDGEAKEVYKNVVE